MTRSSKVRAGLDQEIGALKDRIAQLEKDRDAAYEKWLGLTISACAVPAVIGILGIALMVILAVPTDGASFAIGAAVTGAAVGASAAALGAAAGVARTGYDDLVNEVDAKQEFLKKRVAYRTDLGALDDLVNGPWLKQEEMAAAAANWSRVNAAIRAFTVGGFVDSEVIAFGSDLPADDPEWQKKASAQGSRPEPAAQFYASIPCPT